MSAVLGFCAVLPNGSITVGPSGAAAAAQWTVDDDGVQCPTRNFISIATALSSPSVHVNDTIFVCDGTYPEPTLTINLSGLTLLGPGSTPADDGVATITKSPASGSSTVLITAAGVRFAGFTVDATPPNINMGTYGIEVQANGAVIADNIVTGALGTTFGINVGAAVSPDNVQILRNHLSGNNNSNGDLGCDCRHGIILDNVFTNTGTGYVQITQDGMNFSGNSAIGTEFLVQSDDAVIDNNVLDFTGLDSKGFFLRGDNVTFSRNQLMNSPEETGLLVAQKQDASTSVSITNNTFSSLATAIVARDGFDDAFGTFLTIGGSPQSANVFIDSGKSFNDSNYLLNMVDVHDPAAAEFNNWGFCSAADIEKEIFDGVDEPGVGIVDYDPFISPDPCPTPTATPSPAPTPSPTPTASPTGSETASPSPSPTSSGTVKVHGDGTCDGQVNMHDVIAELSESIGVAPGADCPDEADADCDGNLEGDDALRIARFVANVPAAAAPPCPPVGAIVA